jgi:hypothetical protein
MDVQRGAHFFHRGGDPMFDLPLLFPEAARQAVFAAIRRCDRYPVGVMKATECESRMPLQLTGTDSDGSDAPAG